MAHEREKKIASGPPTIWSYWEKFSLVEVRWSVLKTHWHHCWSRVVPTMHPRERLPKVRMYWCLAPFFRYALDPSLSHALPQPVPITGYSSKVAKSVSTEFVTSCAGIYSGCSVDWKRQWPRSALRNGVLYLDFAMKKVLSLVSVPEKNRNATLGTLHCMYIIYQFIFWKIKIIQRPILLEELCKAFCVLASPSITQKPHIETPKCGNFIHVVIESRIRPARPTCSLRDDQVSQLISYQLKLFHILLGSDESRKWNRRICIQFPWESRLGNTSQPE